MNETESNPRPSQSGVEASGTTPDGSNSKASASIAEVKDRIQPGIDEAKEHLDSGIEKAREQADVGIDKAAQGLDSAAESIKNLAGDGEGPQAQAGVKLAEGMESAATYLKDHSSDEIFKDLEVYVKEHPTQALVGAIFAGFMVGRMMR